MTPQEYQSLAMRTKADPSVIHQRIKEADPRVIQFLIGLNGLVNEVGELADIIKSSLEYGKGPIDLVNLQEEVGDCLWRLAQICDAAGLSLESAMIANIRKLKKRYPNGFSDFEANNRNLAEELKALQTKAPVGWAESQKNPDPYIPQTTFTAKKPIHGVVVKEDLEATMEVGPSGFAEPPEQSESPVEEVEYSADGWSWGRPTESGTYLWFYPSSIPSTAKTFYYNVNISDWGNDSWYKKI